MHSDQKLCMFSTLTAFCPNCMDLDTRKVLENRNDPETLKSHKSRNWVRLAIQNYPLSMLLHSS